MKRFERRDNGFEVVDILAVDDQVRGEGDAMGMILTITDLKFSYPPGEFELVGMGAGAGNPVGMALGRILKTELDVVEARFDELRQTLARKADARGDEVGVEACLASTRD